MKNFSITAKIWFSIGVFVAGFVLSTALGQLNGRSTERNLKLASEALFPAAQKSQEAQSAFERAVKSFGDAIVTQDTSAVDRGAQDTQSAASLIGGIAGIPGLSRAEIADCRRLSSVIAAYASDAESAYGAAAGNPAAMTPEIVGRLRDLASRTEQIEASLKKAREGLARSLQEKLSSTQEGSEHQRAVELALFAATLLAASCVVTMTIRRSIVGPILGVIAGVRISAADAAQTSGEMALAGQVVARDALEQASCLQETSASLKEIFATTRHNSERAVYADGLMVNARDAVLRASEAVHNLKQSMSVISSSSREVAGVLRSLDEIAFNTNILALNAAVEAARAGEAGAGFSVVADEVRSLARRASEAARHSSTIIEKTIGDVAHGVQYVSRADESFRDLSGQIESSAGAVSEIAQSSEAQARGIQVIEHAVSRLERVTQNNAATAQHTASAASSMTAQVERTRHYLQDLVDVVGLSEG